MAVLNIDGVCGALFPKPWLLKCNFVSHITVLREVCFSSGLTVSVAVERNSVRNLVIRKNFGALDGFRTVELGKMSDVSGCFEVVWCSVLNVDRV